VRNNSSDLSVPQRTVYKRPVHQKQTNTDSDTSSSHSYTYSNDLDKIQYKRTKKRCKEQRISDPLVPKRTVYKRPLDQKQTNNDSDTRTNHSNTYSNELDKIQYDASETGVRNNIVVTRPHPNVPCTSVRFFKNEHSLDPTLEQAALVCNQIYVTRSSSKRPKLV
jgi:hypothetical protein